MTSLPIPPHFPGRAVFDNLRPALTSPALTLLVELKTLLRKYENAALPANTTPAHILVHNASQDALYRNVSKLLRQCHGQIRKSAVLKFQARLTAAAARAP